MYVLTNDLTGNLLDANVNKLRKCIVLLDCFVKPVEVLNRYIVIKNQCSAADVKSYFDIVGKNFNTNLKCARK